MNGRRSSSPEYFPAAQDRKSHMLQGHLFTRLTWVRIIRNGQVTFSFGPKTVNQNPPPPQKRFYRKRVELFRLIDKIKLWPSRRGVLHGIRTIEKMGRQARVTTHCNRTFVINNSRNSRSARWLRNKWFKRSCSACRVPDWKMEKYSATLFRRHQGSTLANSENRST